MRVLLVGDPTAALCRLKRTLSEYGWLVDHRDEISDITALTPRPIDLALIHPDRGEAMIARLRSLYQPAVLLSLGDDVTGADGVFADDIPSDHLVGRLIAQMQAHLAGFRDQYRLGDLTIDISRRQVKRGGRNMLLSQREFQLLTLLARASGRVLSRSAIIDHLWLNDDGVADNAVDALASRLRRRIDAPFDDKMLHTVRGVGYCLMAPGP